MAGSDAFVHDIGFPFLIRKGDEEQSVPVAEYTQRTSY